MERGGETPQGHQVVAKERRQGAAAGQDWPRGPSPAGGWIGTGGRGSIEREGKSGNRVFRRSSIGFLRFRVCSSATSNICLGTNNKNTGVC